MNAVATHPAPTTPPAISSVVKKYWGFDTLRPLQLEAINASLSKRDSLVVMPTGGGKSLCYQVPPLVANRTDIVVSPLISLMKDQVDALTANGYPAVALHSGLGDEERRNVMARMSTGQFRLLFVAPERLLTQSFLNLAERLNVRSFAIDEAHCISQWGPDFRPEYAKLAVLKKRFPDASIHAYTATATPRVQQDIMRNLGLSQPKLIVGGFDRPNLNYRIIPRTEPLQQILGIIRRHKDEAVIVYCISRKEAEQLAEGLAKSGVKAAAYHAGMSPAARARTQEQFAAETLDVVVATVAFGMGIDRSNVRCVIHAAMPKSIENYQQETGRAGRDGLEAECVLLYSPQDVRRWEFLIGKSAEESPQPEAVVESNMELIRQLQNFCTAHECRHAALVRYFGQTYDKDNCGACDICNERPQEVPDGAHIARTILACVRDLKVGYGATLIGEILTGSRNARVMSLREDQLNQHGALRHHHKDTLRDFMNQLVHQDFLIRTPGSMPTLVLSPKGRQALEGRGEARLTSHPATDVPVTTSQVSFDYDHSLFDHLRLLRKEIADELQVPPYVVFSDVTLRELAAVRPSALESFRGIRGVGDRKAADYGHRFITAIAGYCRRSGLTLDNRVVMRTEPLRSASLPNQTKEQAFDMFDRGESVSEVCTKLGRTAATVLGYLEEYIESRKPESIDTWVSPERYRTIEEAARRTPGTLLRPVFDALGGRQSYDDIRIVMKHAGLR